MRLLAITVFLLGCDAGAAPAKPEPAPVIPVVQPAPPTRVHAPTPTYVVRDDQDFTTKAMAVVDRMIGTFQQAGKDCDLVERGVRNFRDENRTMLDVLTRYGKEHPSAEKALQEQFKPRMNDFVTALMPTMNACATHKGLQQALQELSTTQLVQQ